MSGATSGSGPTAWIEPRLVGLRLQTLSVMAGKACNGSPKRSSDSGWTWNSRLAVAKSGELLAKIAELRRRHGHRPAPPERIVERHAGAAQQRAVFDIERARAGDAEDRAQLQMVLQVLADAGRSVDQVAAERGDDLRAADARQFEQLRRADRPGGERDFAAGARLAADAVDGVAHADRAPALENQPLDMRAGDDAQVRRGRGSA